MGRFDDFLNKAKTVANVAGKKTGEMVELIKSGTNNIVCTQPFGCLPNHVVGKGVIKELRRRYPKSNVVAIDYDPGASEVNQLNRIKLMLSTAQKNLKKELEEVGQTAPVQVMQSRQENLAEGPESEEKTSA